MDLQTERNIVLALKTLQQGRVKAAEEILQRLVDKLDTDHAELVDVFLNGKADDNALRAWLRV